MLNNNKHCYTINLPETVEDHIIEWFEFMNNQGILSSELARLVNSQINNNSEETALIDSNKKIYISENTDSDLEKDDIFSNLYNWEAANNAAFQSFKKEKKKMLSV